MRHVEYRARGDRRRKTLYSRFKKFPLRGDLVVAGVVLLVIIWDSIYPALVAGLVGYLTVDFFLHYGKDLKRAFNHIWS